MKKTKKHNIQSYCAARMVIVRVWIVFSALLFIILFKQIEEEKKTVKPVVAKSTPLVLTELSVDNGKKKDEKFSLRLQYEKDSLSSKDLEQIKAIFEAICHGRSYEEEKTVTKLTEIYLDTDAYKSIHAFKVKGDFPAYQSHTMNHNYSYKIIYDKTKHTEKDFRKPSLLSAIEELAEKDKSVTRLQKDLKKLFSSRYKKGIYAVIVYEKPSIKEGDVKDQLQMSFQ